MTPRKYDTSNNFLAFSLCKVWNKNLRCIWIAPVSPSSNLSETILPINCNYPRPSKSVQSSWQPSYKLICPLSTASLIKSFNQYLSPGRFSFSLCDVVDASNDEVMERGLTPPRKHTHWLTPPRKHTRWLTPPHKHTRWLTPPPKHTRWLMP